MLTISPGGCPQEQIPDQGQQQDQDQIEEPPPSNQTEDQRPIPQPPIEDDGGTTGPGGSTGGGGTVPPGGEDDLSQPISVVISSPAGADINILPGEEAAINYEVFGGDPADGAISVELFYDLDGIVGSGDEVTLMTNLPPRGLQIFTADLDPGVYYLGLRAANARESQTEYADGRLVIVGEPSAILNQPNTDRRVRPNDSVQVQFTISSLATTIEYQVFTDNDTVVNGNEYAQFTGGGLSGSGTVYFATPDGEPFPAGAYYLGVHMSDSTGQEKTQYLTGAGGNLRTITVDLEPAINVTQPADPNIPVQEGDTVQIAFTASDPEGAAEISVFRDADGAFNGNEAVLTQFSLDTPEEDFTWNFVIPGNLPPATYRIGAWIDDGVGNVVASYAPGSITIIGEPTVSVLIFDLSPLGVRPPETAELVFGVEDPERALKPQPDGIEIKIYADPEDDGVPVDEDGIPTEDPLIVIGDSAFQADTLLFYDIQSDDLVPFLDANGNGLFRVAVSATERTGGAVYEFVPDALYVDSVEPTVELLIPVEGERVLLEKDQAIDISLTTNDTSEAWVVVALDQDTDPLNLNPMPITLVSEIVGGGTVDLDFTGPNAIDLTGVPAGLYYVYVGIWDGVGDPVEFYDPPEVDPQQNPDDLTRVRIRDREIGDVSVADFENEEYENGAVLQGVNSGDLAGSSFEAVPDLTGDGVDEFLLSARFGKAYNIALEPDDEGIGFGEGYLVYGEEGRLQGAQLISAVGGGAIPGLRFPGIRATFSDPDGAYQRPIVPATRGLSDIAVVDDMDGDELPELVFGFPRVESVALSVAYSQFQAPGLFPDLPGMGSLEYDVVIPPGGFNPDPLWQTDLAQFTRGGIVIVSSHNYNTQDPQLLNRKSDRRIDLHEVGQVFYGMSAPQLVSYVRKADLLTPQNQGTLWDDDDRCEDCDEEPDPPPDDDGCGNPTDQQEYPYQVWSVALDTVFNGQGPGGFLMPWTTGDPPIVPVDPPLAKERLFTAGLPFDLDDPCFSLGGDYGCVVLYRWYGWVEEALCFAPLPGTDLFCNGAWQGPPGLPPPLAWTGFYSNQATPRDYTIGARILGQQQEDMFGTALEYDGKFLYMGAPDRTALSSDVPDLLADRPDSGVIYRMRTNLEGATGGLGRLQLWQEPGRSWPRVDLERGNREDVTMPVPHQYIIETIGSIRGDDRVASGVWNMDRSYEGGENGCPPAMAAEGGVDGNQVYNYTPYPPSNSGYWVDRTPQIVGPHEDANIALVRSLGDVDDDGNTGDFAVGCPNAWRDFDTPPSEPFDPPLGAVFIAYEYPDPESNYLLDRIASAGAGRLRGVWIKGAIGAKIGRAFDRAGDFNGDGIKDVIIGSPDSSSQAGEVIVVLGSRTLQSPLVGWNFNEVVAAGRAIRFTGAVAGDQAGFNVAGAGDVDGDGNDDILIAAPGADAGAGTVYLIYGSDEYDPAVQAEYALADAGTVDFPSVVFHGRQAGDQLGGGMVTRTVYAAPGIPTDIDVYSQGVAALGDIDDDGLADVAISAIRAQPNGLEDAGEVYIYYGRGDLETQ